MLPFGAVNDEPAVTRTACQKDPMITSFMADNALHAVHVIMQKGMTQIRALSFCKTDADAGTGVYQVADWAFDGRPKYGEITVCTKCSVAVRGLKEPPKDSPK